MYWNSIIAFYLFSAGVSAGALMIAIAADMLDGRKYERIVKAGAFVAPFPISLGVLALVFDLERPFRFWMLFTTFQADSAMSIGAWLILCFTAVAVLYLSLHLPEGYDYFKVQRIIQAIIGTRPALRRVVQVAGLVLGTGIAGYTGVLLSILVARPFWNTPMLPVLFFLSAVADGAAAICLAACCGRIKEGEEGAVHGNKRFLHCLDVVVLGMLITGVMIFLLGLRTSTEGAVLALQVITGGPLTWHFWLGFVLLGVLIPLAFEIYEVLPYFQGEGHGKHRPWLTGLIGILLLIGGFMLRYVLIYAGQMTQPVL